MHVELPPALSDRGVWGCISPDVPSLPDLLSNPAGDEQDEERFRQNLSALPTPAGGVLLIDEDGLCAATRAVPVVLHGALQQQQWQQPVPQPQQQQCNPHGDGGSQGRLHQTQQQQQQQQQQQKVEGAVQGVEQGVQHMQLGSMQSRAGPPPAAASAQQTELQSGQPPSFSLFSDSLLHSAQLEIEQMLGPPPPDDLSDQIDAALAADWLNIPAGCPSSSGAAFSASPAAPTAASRVGSIAAARSGSDSLSARLGTISTTPPQLGNRPVLHTSMGLAPGVAVETYPPSSLCMGPAAPAALRMASSATGCADGCAGSSGGCGSSGSNLLGSAGCLSGSGAAAAGMGSGYTPLRQMQWGGLGQQGEDPTWTLELPAMLPLNLAGGMAAAAPGAAFPAGAGGAAGLGPLPIDAPSMGLQAGNPASAPLDVSMLLLRGDALCGGTGGFYHFDAAGAAAGLYSQAPTVNPAGPVLTAGVWETASCPAGPGYSLPSWGVPSAAAGSSAPHAPGHPQSYMSLLMSNDEEDSEDPAGAGKAGGQRVRKLRKQAPKGRGFDRRRLGGPLTPRRRPRGPLPPCNSAGAFTIQPNTAGVAAAGAAGGEASAAAAVEPKFWEVQGDTAGIQLVPEPMLFVDLPYKKRVRKRPGSAANAQQQRNKRGPAAAGGSDEGDAGDATDGAGAAAAAASAPAAAATASERGAEGSDGTSSSAPAPSSSRPKRSRRRLVNGEPPLVSEAAPKNKKHALVAVMRTMLERSGKHRSALNLVNQLDKFAAAEGAEGTSAKQKAVQDLAAAAPALYCSLPTMTLLGSAKVEQQCRKNPASQNREEDNFGHHAGHLGWIKCRPEGAPAEEEPAARQAAMAAALKERKRAAEIKKSITECGSDVAAAKQIFLDMIKERNANASKYWQQVAQPGSSSATATAADNTTRAPAGSNSSNKVDPSSISAPVQQLMQLLQQQRTQPQQWAAEIEMQPLSGKEPQEPAAAVPQVLSTLPAGAYGMGPGLFVLQKPKQQQPPKQSSQPPQLSQPPPQQQQELQQQKQRLEDALNLLRRCEGVPLPLLRLLEGQQQQLSQQLAGEAQRAEGPTVGPLLPQQLAGEQAAAVTAGSLQQQQAGVQQAGGAPGQLQQQQQQAGGGQADAPAGPLQGLSGLAELLEGLAGTSSSPNGAVAKGRGVSSLIQSVASLRGSSSSGNTAGQAAAPSAASEAAAGGGDAAVGALEGSRVGVSSAGQGVTGMQLDSLPAGLDPAAAPGGKLDMSALAVATAAVACEGSQSHAAAEGATACPGDQAVGSCSNSGSNHGSKSAASGAGTGGSSGCSNVVAGGSSGGCNGSSDGGSSGGADGSSRSAPGGSKLTGIATADTSAAAPATAIAAGQVAADAQRARPSQAAGPESPKAEAAAATAAVQAAAAAAVAAAAEATAAAAGSPSATSAPVQVQGILPGSFQVEPPFVNAAGPAAAAAASLATESGLVALQALAGTAAVQQQAAVLLLQQQSLQQQAAATGGGCIRDAGAAATALLNSLSLCKDGSSAFSVQAPTVVLAAARRGPSKQATKQPARAHNTRSAAAAAVAAGPGTRRGRKGRGAATGQQQLQQQQQETADSAVTDADEQQQPAAAAAAADPDPAPSWGQRQPRTRAARSRARSKASAAAAAEEDEEEEDEEHVGGRVMGAAAVTAAAAAAAGRPRRAKRQPRKLSEFDVEKLGPEEGEQEQAATDDPDEEETSAAADDDDSSGPGPGADTDKEDMDFDEDLLSDDENEENKTYRVPPAKNRPGGKDREISLEQLRTRYHLTIAEASKSLDIGATALKSFLRKWGIKRWPSRKYNAVKKLISEVRMYDPQGLQEEEKQLVLDRLHQTLQDIITNPDVEIAPHIRQLQDAVYKLRSKQRAKTKGTDPLQQLGVRGGVRKL